MAPSARRGFGGRPVGAALCCLLLLATLAELFPSASAGLTGADDRRRVASPAAFPFRTLARLEIRGPFGSHTCSGSLIAPRFVLTAASCIFRPADPARGRPAHWVDAVAVTIGRIGVRLPYGRVRTTELHVPDGFRTAAAAGYTAQAARLDWGVVKLATAVGAGSMGRWPAPYAGLVTVAGYPYSLAGGLSPHLATCAFRSGPQPASVLCDGTEGQSGAPAFRGSGAAASIVGIWGYEPSRGGRIVATGLAGEAFLRGAMGLPGDPCARCAPQAVCRGNGAGRRCVCGSGFVGNGTRCAAVPGGVRTTRDPGKAVPTTSSTSTTTSVTTTWTATTTAPPPTTTTTPRRPSFGSPIDYPPYVPGPLYVTNFQMGLSFTPPRNVDHDGTNTSQLLATFRAGAVRVIDVFDAGLLNGLADAGARVVLLVNTAAHMGLPLPVSGLADHFERMYAPRFAALKAGLRSPLFALQVDHGAYTSLDSFRRYFDAYAAAYSGVRAAFRRHFPSAAVLPMAPSNLQGDLAGFFSLLSRLPSDGYALDYAVVLDSYTEDLDLVPYDRPLYLTRVMSGGHLYPIDVMARWVSGRRLNVRLFLVDEGEAEANAYLAAQMVARHNLGA